MPAGQLFWPDEMTAQLKQLWETSLSCRGIADVMGISRNAVIGKVHRLGLEPRAKVIPKGPKGNKTPRGKYKRRLHTAHTRDVLGKLVAPVAFVPRVVEVEPLEKGLLELADNACRYPGDETPITFCGHPKQAGSSYCPAHHALCWRPRTYIDQETFHRTRLANVRAYKAELVA